MSTRKAVPVGGWGPRPTLSPNARSVSGSKRSTGTTRVAVIVPTPPQQDLDRLYELAEAVKRGRSLGSDDLEDALESYSTGEVDYGSTKYPSSPATRRSPSPLLTDFSMDDDLTLDPDGLDCADSSNAAIDVPIGKVRSG